MTAATLDPTTEELDNADLYEIIDGVKVEMPPISAESTILASRLACGLQPMPRQTIWVRRTRRC